VVLVIQKDEKRTIFGYHVNLEIIFGPELFVEFRV